MSVKHAVSGSASNITAVHRVTGSVLNESLGKQQLTSPAQNETQIMMQTSDILILALSKYRVANARSDWVST